MMMMMMSGIEDGGESGDISVALWDRSIDRARAELFRVWRGSMGYVVDWRLELGLKQC